MKKTKNQRGIGSTEHRALTDIEKIINNAILFDTITVQEPSAKLGKSSILMHHLYCPIISNGKKGIAKIYVSENLEGTHKFYLTKIEEVTHAITENNITAAVGHRANGTAGDTSSKISVSEIFDFVKENDQKFEADSKHPVYFCKNQKNHADDVST